MYTNKELKLINNFHAKQAKTLTDIILGVKQPEHGMRQDGKYWCTECQHWTKGITNGFGLQNGDNCYEVICEVCGEMLDED